MKLNIKIKSIFIINFEMKILKIKNKKLYNMAEIMKIKICPQCGTRYSKKEDQFKTVCSLKHCPYCGSIRTNFNDNGIGGGMLVIFLTIFVCVFTVIIGQNLPIIPGIIILLIELLLGTLLSIYIFSLRKCFNCNSNFSSFQYKRHIPLKEIEEDEESWEEI